MATRPAAQNTTWCARLKTLGLSAIPIPIIEIEPLTEAEDRQKIKSIVLNFDQFDHIIFVSQNAVLEAFRWLDQYWPQWPLGIEYWGIGSKTTERLMAQGVKAHTANSAMNSEALLEQVPLQEVDEKKILICRGKGGRTHLGDQLVQRGAKLSYCELYHRKLAPTAKSQLQALEWRDASSSLVISVFSGETLERVSELMAQIDVPHWQDIPILVPGQRVTELAQKLGYSRVIRAGNATEEKMSEALLQWCDCNGVKQNK